MEPEITTSEPAVDNFDSLLELENRIQGIADRFGEARRLQQTAEQNATRLERVVSEQEQTIERLRAEIEQLRGERHQVRERIETLLARIDSL
jgi:FtsZ-binding cell division protein ZapB